MQWQALKQRAQAVFVIEAIKSRKLTLWEAFTAFDYDNNGVLSPAEFYGALVWLGVPNLTAEDVADFIEAADKNRDGMVDYREYMAMLSPPQAASEFQDDVEDVTDIEKDDSEEEQTPIAKVEPYGAEELREVMVHRKQLEQTRQREERLRRQAYQESLDVKVFEEELEASKSRKGGANPLIIKSSLASGGQGEDSKVTITDFKFSTNQHPLRFAVTGKNSFIPIFLGTAADVQVHPMRCPKNHVLNNFNYYWMECHICQRRSTSWCCWQGSCNYYICNNCYEADRRGREQDRRDPAKHPTFLRCLNQCWFTLQIPTAGGACVSSGDYSLLMELRMEKLPPQGHLQSLLRFSLPDLAHARRMHRTSVYIRSDGKVVGRPIATSSNDLVSSQCADNADLNSSRMRAGLWCILCIVVQPSKGTLVTYINGNKCMSFDDLETSELVLHHKLVVFGGGKQAHARGGDIRRLSIYNIALNEKEVLQSYYSMANNSPVLGGRIAKIQAIYLGYILRKINKSAHEKEAQAAKEELKKDEESSESEKNSA